MRSDAMILVFWMLSFKPDFSLASFTFIKRLFSSSSLYAIRVVSSAYLRLLIFLPAILIPACTSSSQAFHMIYSAYKLNKQSDNIQPWCTPFPTWNQSVVPCSALTVASWPAKFRLRLKKVEKTTRSFMYNLNQIPYSYTVELTNRFKALDLIDRMLEEVRTEVDDIVQEAVIKTIPKRKKCKKGKWLSEEALQIAEKRRDVKSKGEKERYTHLNAEFQRIASRVRKPSSAINAKK